ncbi:hypothetical protein ERJ75_001516300 [Trypanosoma vivax]|nr:hypothetical protein ERJ75_001516300 [Trypanosoma vivax]
MKFVSCVLLLVLAARWLQMRAAASDTSAVTNSHIVACEVTKKTSHGRDRYNGAGLRLHDCSWPPNRSSNSEVRCGYEGHGHHSPHFTQCSDGDPKGIVFANCTADREQHRWLSILDDHSGVFDLICLNCPFDANQTIEKIAKKHHTGHFSEVDCREIFDAMHNSSTRNKVTKNSTGEAPSTAPTEAPSTAPREEDGNKTVANATVDSQSPVESPEERDRSNNLKSGIAESIKGAQLNESGFNVTLPAWGADAFRSSIAKQSAPLSVAGTFLLHHLNR